MYYLERDFSSAVAIVASCQRPASSSLSDCLGGGDKRGAQVVAKREWNKSFVGSEIFRQFCPGGELGNTVLSQHSRAATPRQLSHLAASFSNEQQGIERLEKWKNKNLCTLFLSYPSIVQLVTCACGVAVSC